MDSFTGVWSKSPKWVAPVVDGHTGLLGCAALADGTDPTPVAWGTRLNGGREWTGRLVRGVSVGSERSEEERVGPVADEHGDEVQRCFCSDRASTVMDGSRGRLSPRGTTREEDLARGGTGLDDGSDDDVVTEEVLVVDGPAQFIP